MSRCPYHLSWPEERLKRRSIGGRRDAEEELKVRDRQGGRADGTADWSQEISGMLEFDGRGGRRRL